MAKTVARATRSSRREDPKKQFRVVTGFGQFLVVAIGLASSIISFIQFGVSWTAILLSALSAALLLSLLANGMFLLDKWSRKKGARNIVFLTPSSGDQPFYVSMLAALVRNASLAQGQNYVVIPAMPTRSFETISIWSLFASLEDRQFEIDGIIFIPDSPDSRFDELVGFHEQRGEIPIVLVDVYFDQSACDDRTRARLPSFVGGDERAGGRVACEIIKKAVGPPPDRPIVLIINGADTPWERQRAIAFRESLLVAWPNTTFLETGPINYSRPAARDETLKLLKEVANDRAIPVCAVFACNDDMAIGARAAIGRLRLEGYTFLTPPQIVGYDGIAEIREYIDAADEYIAGTVDVRIDEQASKTMMLMHQLLRTGSRKGEVHLVAPVAYARA